MHPLKINELKHDFDKAFSYKAYSINAYPTVTTHKASADARIAPPANSQPHAPQLAPNRHL